MASRQHYSASNAGPVNNTNSAAWVDAVALAEFEPDASSTYALFWSVALQNATNNSADAQLRVRFGPPGFETTITTLNIESAVTAEYPQIAGMFFHVEDVAPVGVICDLAIKPETNTNSINAKNGQIVALKLGANDVKAESLARQSTTSTTPQSAVTANFTSDGGDYVIVGSGEFDINAGTAPAYMRLTCDGTNTAELGVRSNDTTNLTPGMMVWRFTAVPAGARSSSFQYRAHSGLTAGIANARILVMRAADFDAVYGAQLTSDSTGTQSDAIAITFTETLTANPHLLLGGWGTSGTTANTNITTQLTEAGTDIAESIRRTYNAAATRFHNSAFTSVRTPGSGSKAYTLDRVQAGSTSITVGTGSALSLIDLGSTGSGGDANATGAALSFSRALGAGAATATANATGSAQAITFSLVGGAASSAVNGNAAGASLSVTISASTGAANGAANATGAALTVARSISGGAGTGTASATGAGLSQALSVSGGAATGNAAATGSALSVTHSLSAGAASSAANGDATGADISVGLSLVGGTATGQGNSTGAALSVAQSIGSGAATGGAGATGTARTVTLTLIAGSASSVGDGSAPGTDLTVAYSLRSGKARGPIPPEAFGKTGRMWQPFGQSFAA